MGDPLSLPRGGITIVNSTQLQKAYEQPCNGRVSRREPLSMIRSAEHHSRHVQLLLSPVLLLLLPLCLLPLQLLLEARRKQLLSEPGHEPAVCVGGA